MAGAGMATFGAAASEHPDPAQAIAEAAGSVLDLVGPGADMAVLFVTGPHREMISEIAEAARAILRPVGFVGSTAISVIGGRSEIEEVPAVSLWAGHVGDVEAVRLEVVHTPDGTAVVGMPDDAAIGRRILVLLAEPFSFPTKAFVQASNEQYPDLTIVGGMASAGGPGANRLVVQAETHHEGAVGILLPEGLDAATVVSQGCRPVGDPYTVTRSDGNLIHELGSRPALDRLRAVIDEADDEDREKLARGLHVGLVVNETAEAFGTGDFLIRGVLGADHAAGALRIGDEAPLGSTLQFHVRDAASATDDMTKRFGAIDADAALVFTCNGRGSTFFGRPDHDAELVFDAVHGGAVAGMFCAGEIGPVGSANHVHGFTASTLLFYG